MSATVILLEAEAQRIASLLSTVDPLSAGYRTLLDHISQLHYIKSMVANEPSCYLRIEPTTDDTDTSVPPVELTQPEEDKVVPFTAVEEEPPSMYPKLRLPPSPRSRSRLHLRKSVRRA